MAQNGPKMILEHPAENVIEWMASCMNDLEEKDRICAERTLRILQGDRMSRSFEEQFALGIVPSAENSVRIVADVLQKLLDRSRKPPVIRMKEWEVFTRWLEALARRTGMSYVPVLIKPVENDGDILLLKALHAPCTKEELAGQLRVGKKTIQNKLHAIHYGTGDVRLGGQLVQVKVSSTPNETRKNLGYKYQTVNRMHPVVLQLNTAQVGALLIALACDSNYYAVNRITAAYIWEQLSDPGKKRIEEIFAPLNKELRMLIEELNEAEDESLYEKAFREEQDFLESGDLDLSQQLLFIMKGGHRCTIRVRQNGRERFYKNCRLKATHSSGVYALVPSQKKGTVENQPGEAAEILIREDEVIEVNSVI